MTTDPDLKALGWSTHFARQLDDDEASLPRLRIANIHRDRLGAIGISGEVTLTCPPDMPTSSLAVGDWVLAEADTPVIRRRLTPRGELRRKAAGKVVESQLIAANVDTLFIVTSCNADFNIARLERYLALAEAGGALPVIVLTRADEVDDTAPFLSQARRLSPIVTALALDARDPEQATALTPWCGPGDTVALVGSSGVGKSTLLNALAGTDVATGAIREDDAKGRHTTTHRDLKPAKAGGWIIDTPGMRELQLVDAAEGIDAVFEDLAELALECRFSDCAHDSEPGCAVRRAIDTEEVEEARFERWQKLLREDARNTESVAEARQRDRSLSRVYREGQSRGRYKRGDY
ncbi:ribosome small subunit-dependent GTPase A [Shimia biformata]|uniref:ribosome small subunit-dependent GTPase A n=1 Tax=Shimia biformata TaxID=1294299 RepID=UPI00194EE116|nr:ribosome small subunit-dependent GTPase A [Shimia biformata]